MAAQPRHPRKLRAYAGRSRERVLEAARELFDEGGAASVARFAGVALIISDLIMLKIAG